MKKRTKLLAITGATIAGLTIFGGSWFYLSRAVVDASGITERHEQLEYLKAHEQEIIHYVKSQNDKIESVQIDWNDVRGGNVSHPFSNEKYVRVYGRINGIENSGWGVLIYTSKGKLDISTMILGNDIKVGGEYLE